MPARCRTVPKAIEAVAAQRAIGDERGLAQALAALGLALGNQGQLDEAELVLDEGLEIARRLDNGVAIARLLDRLGFIAGRQGIMPVRLRSTARSWRS